VYCEKPLAFNLKDAREMLDAARKAGVVHMVNFNYRVVPALALAQQMIKAGEIGEFDTSGPRIARLAQRSEVPDELAPAEGRGRIGANGDLNAHHVDMARFLVGEIGEVVGMKKTFITERPAEGRSAGLTATAGEGTEKVTVDDATLFLAKFSNGALGSFEATRLAPGRKNSTGGDQRQQRLARVQLRRDERAAVLPLWRPGGRQGFRQIMATEGVHPYVRQLVAAGHVLGYEHTFVHAVYELMGAIQQEADDHGRFPRWGAVRGGAGCG